jgi:hypothetical protein
VRDGRALFDPVEKGRDGQVFSDGFDLVPRDLLHPVDLVDLIRVDPDLEQLLAIEGIPASGRGADSKPWVLLEHPDPEHGVSVDVVRPLLLGEGVNVADDILAQLFRLGNLGGEQLDPLRHERDAVGLEGQRPVRVNLALLLGDGEALGRLAPEFVAASGPAGGPALPDVD